jgi:cytochrome c553
MKAPEEYKGLSAEDIEAVTAYYASLPARP